LAWAVKLFFTGRIQSLHFVRVIPARFPALLFFSMLLIPWPLYFFSAPSWEVELRPPLRDSLLSAFPFPTSAAKSVGIMRILAIDYGTRRVGLAVSDETGTIALPLSFLPAEPAAQLLEQLQKTANEKGVGEVVVGVPRNMNGTYGPAAEKARAFAAELQKTLTVPVRTWDERLTTVQAHRALIETGMRRDQRKLRVDQTAAAILLQSYLDRVQQ
jgi:putative holliday junction resolvase